MVKDVRGFTKCQIGRRIGLYSVLPTYTYEIIWIVSRFMTSKCICNPFVKAIWRKNMYYCNIPISVIGMCHLIDESVAIYLYLFRYITFLRLANLSNFSQTFDLQSPPNLQYEKFFNIYWTQKPGSCRPI